MPHLLQDVRSLPSLCRPRSGWVMMASRPRSLPRRAGACHVDIGANLITKANMKSARSQELLNAKIR